MELVVGQIVEHWTVQRSLGTGGMADVYLVKHNQLGSKHALKVMRAAGESTRKRLVAEGQVQAQVKHPTLVLVTDMLDVYGDVGLVMQYIEGPSLDEWSTTQHPLDVTMRIFVGIVEGMQFAHANGFIHRDLKPTNIILQRTEEGLTPRIIDFGLVKVLGEAKKSASITNPGAMMGTPEYMSPEQIGDASTVDAGADMWALGTLLYRLVCGVNAFGPGRVIDTLNAVITGEFKPPRAHRPDLADNIVNAINGLMTVDRDARIPDCETLISVLGLTEDISGAAKRWIPQSATVETTPLPIQRVPARAVDQPILGGLLLSMITLFAAWLVWEGQP